MVSETLLKELNQVLKRDYKKSLNRTESVEVADNLIKFFEILIKIQAKEQLKNKNNSNEKDN